MQSVDEGTENDVTLRYYHLRSAHLENTFREYVSAGHSVFLQGSGLLPATLTLIFFISRHVE